MGSFQRFEDDIMICDNDIFMHRLELGPILRAYQDFQDDFLDIMIRGPHVLTIDDNSRPIFRYGQTIFTNLDIKINVFVCVCENVRGGVSCEALRKNEKTAILLILLNLGYTKKILVLGLEYLKLLQIMISNDIKIYHDLQIFSLKGGIS